MNLEEDNQVDPTEEGHSEIQPTYNFKWMLILLLVGIVGSFIFASFKR